MTISSKIVASYVEGFSGLYIDAPKEKLDEVAKCFEELFEAAWNDAMDEAEEEYDTVCQEKEDDIGSPASAEIEDDRIFVAIEPLSMAMNYGVRSDNEYGPEALEKALADLKTKYPEISYEGIVAYEWCDEHGSDVVNYEIRSDNSASSDTKTYSFVGKKLNEVLNDEVFSEEFWEKMGYQLDDADEEDLQAIVDDFNKYGVDQESVDRLMELAEEMGIEIQGEDEDEE